MSGTAVRAMVATLAAVGLLAACSGNDSSQSPRRAAPSTVAGQPSLQSPSPGSASPGREGWRNGCPGVLPRFNVGALELRGKTSVGRAAESWLLPNEQTGSTYTVNARTRMVQVVRNSQVARVLELVRTKRGWLPEWVVACHAAILRGPEAVPPCSPEVISAQGTRYSQQPIRRGPQLGIAATIMLVRVSKCGVVLPGRRLLALEADIWPVTTYTRSEESAADGQLVSILVGRGRDQRFFPTEFEGTE